MIRKILISSFLVVLGVGFGGLSNPAIADGPYGGRVIDAETKQAISDAVVVAVWEKKLYRVYRTETQLDAVMEVKTDKNGDFEIPGYVDGPLENDLLGVQPPRFYIFKPGFGSYPNSHVRPWTEIKTHFRPFSFIELPRLKTSYERRLVQMRTDRLNDIPSKYVPLWTKALSHEGQMIQAMEEEKGRASSWADGTFYGRVVDEDTGKPIHGAIVLSVWWNYSNKEGRTPLAVREVITGPKGMFSMEGLEEKIFRNVPVGIQPPEFYIFKPGYAGFPGPEVKPSETFRVAFRPFADSVSLKKLNNAEDRYRDLRQFNILAALPLEQAPRFLGALNKERARVGLKPVRVVKSNTSLKISRRYPSDSNR